MINQQRWVKIMNPIAAQLKFRLPYTGIRFANNIDPSKDMAPYLPGIVFKQPYVGPTSTETRLVVTREMMVDGQYPIAQWNFRHYEDQMFYQNVVIREEVKYYNPSYVDTGQISEDERAKSPLFPPELNNRWDELTEYLIFDDYLKVVGASDQVNTIKALVLFLSSLLSSPTRKLSLSFIRQNPKIQARLERGPGAVRRVKFNIPLNEQELRVCEENENLPFLPSMPDNYPRLKYRQGTVKGGRHFGQCKLLLSEIEFFTLFPEAKQVLYIGAAPGFHIASLQKLFPQHKFYLYDPVKFAIPAGEKVQIFNTIFTDAEAAKYTDKTLYPDLLFISDIRTSTEDKAVLDNLTSQARWAATIKPVASLLKFRLPFSKGQTKYFNGDVRFQAYAPPESAETRMIVTDTVKQKVFDHTDYEQKMYFFNTCLRPKYDKQREEQIIKDYLRVHGPGQKQLIRTEIKKCKQRR